jgi:hypothetical protein
MIKKILKILAIIVAVAFIAIQFFRIDKTNPPIVEAETIDAVLAVPPDVALILGRSCNDCHTNKTIYPWYSNVQPAAWFLKNHIDDGKRHFNLSTFATYDAKKRAKKLDEVCEQVDSGEMPLPSYLWIHRDAVLSESDKKAICDWTKDAAAKLSSTASSTAEK